MIGDVQALWGTHLIRTTDKHIQPIIDGLSLSSELNVEELESTEAQNPLNVRGGDAQKLLSVTFAVSIHAGCLDPLFEYHSWVRDLGKSLPFIVQYRPFGPKRLVLERVSMSDALFGPGGKIIYALITADFTEDMPATTKAKEVTEETKDISKAEKSAKAKESGLKFTDADLKRGRELIGTTS